VFDGQLTLDLIEFSRKYCFSPETECVLDETLLITVPVFHSCDFLHNVRTQVGIIKDILETLTCKEQVLVVVTINNPRCAMLQTESKRHAAEAIKLQKQVDRPHSFGYFLQFEKFFLNLCIAPIGYMNMFVNLSSHHLPT
jgi:hypothetical protein